MKRLFALFFSSCLQLQILLLAICGHKITYLPAEENVTRVLLKEAEAVSNPILILHVTQNSDSTKQAYSIRIFNRRSPISLESDTIGGSVWRLADASNRVLECDSVSIPIVFDFEKDVNSKVFNRIFVGESEI